MRILLKSLAWIMIVGGGLGHPIVYGLLIAHHLQPQHINYEGYIIPQEIYMMTFGAIGSVTGGAMLLILLDIQRHVRTDTTIKDRF